MRLQRQEAAASREEEREVVGQLRSSFARAQEQHAELYKRRTAEQAAAVNEQQLVVRALKREMRERIETLGCAKRALYFRSPYFLYSRKRALCSHKRALCSRKRVRYPPRVFLLGRHLPADVDVDERKCIA